MAEKLNSPCPQFMREASAAMFEAAPAPQPDTDSLGIPLVCGGPLCTPKDHNPYCKVAAAPKAYHIADASKMVPALLQQGEYLPLPRPEYGKESGEGFGYTADQVCAAIDADRAARGAALSAPAQPGWCDGCSPDNCGGCATPAAPAQADEYPELPVPLVLESGYGPGDAPDAYTAAQMHAYVDAHLAARGAAQPEGGAKP